MTPFGGVSLKTERWVGKMPDKRIQFAENTLECFLLAALVLIPLFFNPYGVLPFEEAKVPLLRSLALLALPFLVFPFVKKGLKARTFTNTGQGWSSGLAVAALVLAYTYLLSTAFSVSPSDSFFGMYLRRQGTYTALCYLFFFFVVLRTIHTRRQIEGLLFAFLLAGFTVSVWAILQRLGLDPDVEGSHGTRVWSTLGNPIFLSAFLIMTAPLHLYFLSRSLQRLEECRGQGISSGRSRAEVLFFMMVFLFFAANLAALMLAESRGPTLGLFVGLFLLMILHVLRQGRRRAVAGLLVIGGLLILMLVFLSLPGQQSAGFTDMPLLDRLDSAFQSKSGRVRTHIWKGVFDLFVSNPGRILTGYGPETLSLVFPRHNPPMLQYLEKPTAFADRAHNELLDLLVMQGILGLAAFLLFFGILCRFVLKQLGLIPTMKRDIAFGGIVLVSGFLGFLVPYAASGETVYSGLGLGLGLVCGLFLYILFLALTTKREALSSPWHPQGLLLSTILAALVGHFVEIQFCFGTTATRLSFWVLAALAVVAGRNSGEDSDVPVDHGHSPFFLPSTVIPAFLAALVIATTTFDYVAYSETNRGFLWAVFGCHLGVFIAGAMFSLSQMERAGERPCSPVRGLTAYSVLTLAFGGLYLLSYFFLETRVAQLIHTHTPDSLLAVVERNTHLGSYYGWILAFVGVSSLLLLLGNAPHEKRQVTLKVALLFPLLVLLTLPLVIASSIKGSMADIYTMAGRDLMQSKHWNAAQFCFSKAVSLEPSQAWRHQKLGYLYFTRAKKAKEPEKSLLFQQAMYHGQKATQLSPLEATLKNNLARMSYVWTRATKEEKTRFYRLKVTETLYAEALKTDRNNAFLWKEAGKIAAALGKNEGAVQCFEHVLELNPSDFKPHLALSILYRSLKRYAEALTHAETAFQLAGQEDRAEIESLVTELKDKVAETGHGPGPGPASPRGDVSPGSRGSYGNGAER